MMFNFSTTTFPAVRSTDNTLPDFPRFRPAITTTVSPFRILVFCSANTGTPSSIRLQHFRSERDDFHELFPTKFPRDRTEDASSHRFTVLINQDAGIAIELDIGPVIPAHFLGRSHNDRAADVALLDGGLRNRFLDRHHNHVAE